MGGVRHTSTYNTIRTEQFRQKHFEQAGAVCVIPIVGKRDNNVLDLIKEILIWKALMMMIFIGSKDMKPLMYIAPFGKR